ncbi:MAG: hypothetical protein IKT69_01335 [Bacteroidales bacterium]|nr:hypothetical protein [Bacteroidales bacterium]
MSRLIDNIADFLAENGFELSFQIRHDFDVIVTRTLDGRHIKVILPLEISAGTIEEAEAESENAEYAIRMITREAGYPLIITEDRWRSQRQMMEARLLAHLELFSQAYARNCEVRRIEKAEAQEFLNRNHSYGYAACKYRYGLFLKRHTGHIAAEMGFPIRSGTTNGEPGTTNGKVEVPDEKVGRTSSPVILNEVKNLSEGTLIAVATFSNARRWVKEGKEIRSYEWTRYASLPDLRVSGGMGKMLKAFIKEVKPDDIMSYADLEWSEGEVYERLGFEAETRKEPVTFTIDPQTWERKAIRRSPVKPGMTEEKPGMTEEKPGMTEEKPGMTEEKPGMAEEKPGMTEEKPGMTEGDNVIPDLIGDLFFRNFGSRKFRLKLTDYK